MVETQYLWCLQSSDFHLPWVCGFKCCETHEDTNLYNQKIKHASKHLYTISEIYRYPQIYINALNNKWMFQDIISIFKAPFLYRWAKPSLFFPFLFLHNFIFCSTYSSWTYMMNIFLKKNRKMFFISKLYNLQLWMINSKSNPLAYTFKSFGKKKIFHLSET